MYPSHPSTQFYYLFVQKKNKKKNWINFIYLQEKG